MKTIDKLPRSILILIAKEFGHRNPESCSNFELAQFISSSI